MRKSRFAKTICTLIMPIINQESGPTVGATAQDHSHRLSLKECHLTLLEPIHPSTSGIIVSFNKTQNHKTSQESDSG
jgi:hypothetical protein